MRSAAQYPFFKWYAEPGFSPTGRCLCAHPERGSASCLPNQTPRASSTKNGGILRTELKSNAALGELLQTAGSNMVLLKTKPLLQHLVLTMLGLVLIEVLLVVVVI